MSAPALPLPLSGLSTKMYDGGDFLQSSHLIEQIDEEGLLNDWNDFSSEASSDNENCDELNINQSDQLDIKTDQNHLQNHGVSTLESNNAVPDSASRTTQLHSKFTSDDKIRPLLGSPYFTMIMAKSQIYCPYQLIVPSSFRKYLPFDTVKALLVCRGKTWEIRYCGRSSLRRFSCGWKKFVEDNNLKVGDGCVFELLDDKELKFRVQILNGQMPKIGSYDLPINIH